MSKFPALVGTFAATPGTMCHLSVAGQWLSGDVLGWGVDEDGDLWPLTLGLPISIELNRFAIEMPDGSVRFQDYHFDTSDEFRDKILP